ncbi:dynamin-related protein 4C-like [Vicia villosa]|uniref:dynamin-related protein 4C-like n=1 Tax=Vicia villosa TaxID=3911 RepID=UPI00273B2CEC|nr:dynamin-related protein 4C-like [Vicia villosa]
MDDYNKPDQPGVYLQNSVDASATSLKNRSVAVGKEFTTQQIKWQPPEAGWVKINTDCACRDGNVAGCGGIIRDNQGDCKGGLAKFLANCNIVKADLWGIFVELSLAKDLGYYKVYVNVDSTSTIDMIQSGRALDLNSHSLVKQILELMKIFEDIKVIHSYRQTNRCADALAKFDATTRNFLIFGEEFPIFIRHLLNLHSSQTNHQTFCAFSLHIHNITSRFLKMDESSLALVHGVDHQPQPLTVAPIVSSYNEKIRPVLDALENLRRLNIAKEGIQLPTIVVVGDQSSGKSSVLESLAGISLPRGQGICTRVPLVMRLQNHSHQHPELVLEYNGKNVSTDEANVSDAINTATEELAGTSKGVSNTPLTLIVKKNGVPDLTMVDLPGITRVPVHGQPDNICDQIKDMIMEYITPEESIILNVISANVDFATCESIRMSQTVDKTGLRTLAVVTKSDKSPEGLLEKVTADDVNIGLGYVCVRNRIGDESYEEAKDEEQKLFESHSLLSKIDKSIVGIPVLAQKLVQVQAMIISKTLPEIIKNINEKLAYSLHEMEILPANLSSLADAMSAFLLIVSLSRDSLRKILLIGEFEEYPDENKMHCTARLVDMLNSYANELQNCDENESNATRDFLMDEIKVLEEAKFISLPNFMPRTAFLTLLQKKVRGISHMPTNFVDSVWNYLESVVTSVLNRHSANYYQLQVSTRRAAEHLIAKKKENSIQHVMQAVEMEKHTDYTCNPEYLQEYNKLMLYQQAFVKEVLYDYRTSSTVKLEGVGDIEVNHLRNYHTNVLTQAFDLKARFIAYWKIVLRRLIDVIALHLMLSINELVNVDLQKEICNEVGGSIESLLEESPSITMKREKLSRSVKVLRESKETVAKIMDRIGVYGDKL